MRLMELLDISTIYKNDWKWLWSNITIDARLNRELLISEIVNKCAQSHVRYSTCATFKAASEAFFLKWNYQIGKLIDTQEFEYNPIWNKDGEIREERELNRIRVEGVEDTFEENRNSERTENSNSTNENTVSAFNSSSYQPNDKNTSDYGLNSNNEENVDSARNIDTNENEGETEKTKRIEQGNIGVTSTQSLINEERGLYEFNIYDWITKKYHEELFLRVW